ncbi:TetR/AcrR family transcriptional regulator [Paenibacillus ehimensis]|uniref:TetR/AcrR family transcriptional regulator n=1 Tax=Paenibacillus ehimensis TaxID=79264 RepID=A0ABT8V9Z4_9BACL|nr:TetR/AcrR family transcriptional regulator [Paenibacillus ehimensis]MDO3677799.1 TetR/AcrR family transcriptional regulator [Paenibacillus ehimensis]
MPKFRKEEKEAIRECLLSKGKELFIQYGLKKTSLDDIVAACGIAKGSFYSFFATKEELYFEIAKREESFKDKLLADMLSSELPPKVLLHELFRTSFETIDANPFLQRVFRQDEWEQLVRKLPQETLQQHAEEDTRAAQRLFEKWQGQGAMLPLEHEVVAGLLRAVVFVSLHKAELGGVYGRVVELLIRFVVNGLTASDADGTGEGQ